jgi:hypothetical protein
MKIISAGTPYFEKNPCSLAAHRGSTLAFTAAWAMTLLVGAAAVRAVPGINNPSITKQMVMHLSIVDSFPGYSSRVAGDTKTLRHTELKVPAQAS